MVAYATLGSMSEADDCVQEAWRSGCSPWPAARPAGQRMATVNGASGLVGRDADGVLSVIAFTIDAGRITALDVVRNPDKLTTVQEPG